MIENWNDCVKKNGTYMICFKNKQILQWWKQKTYLCYFTTCNIWAFSAGILLRFKIPSLLKQPKINKLYTVYVEKPFTCKKAYLRLYHFVDLNIFIFNIRFCRNLSSIFHWIIYTFVWIKYKISLFGQFYRYVPLKSPNVKSTFTLKRFCWKWFYNV